MIPIKKITLYKNGIAFFERRGKVTGDENVHFSFKTKDMPDILKTLTVFDTGKGLIESVSYDSTLPIEKRLENLCISVPEKDSFVSLIEAMKGVHVEITVASDVLSGRIVGTDNHENVREGERYKARLVTILDDNGVMVSKNILDISHLKITDEIVSNDLNIYLKEMITARKKEMKELIIKTQGEQDRDLIVRYAMEFPVWKTGYRCVLETGEKPFIQGWAVVDNVLDEHWENVELSLVSGSPVSFRHDLYSPRFMMRPEIKPKTTAMMAPIDFEEGLGEELYEGCELEMDDLKPEKKMAREPRFMMSRGAGGIPPPSPVPTASMMRESVAPDVKTSEVGDIFTYHLSHPVSVDRNQSALVPIVQSAVEGEKVLIYNSNAQMNHPVTSLKFKNTSGVTLEGGPILFIENNMFVGEAMLPTLKKNEDRYVGFGVDAGVSIIKENTQNTEKILKATITKGVLRFEKLKKRTLQYKIKNKKQEPVKLIIEHPRDTNWDILNKDGIIEETEHFTRFEVALDVEKAISFSLLEKKMDYSSVSLISSDKNALRYYITGNYIDEAVKQVFNAVIKLKEQIFDIEKKINEAQLSIDETVNDQDRLRDNLESLSDTAEEKKLRSRIVNKLDAQETLIEEKRLEIKNLMKNIEELKTSIATKLKEITFEKIFS